MTRYFRALEVNKLLFWVQQQIEALGSLYFQSPDNGQLLLSIFNSIYFLFDFKFYAPTIKYT